MQQSFSVTEQKHAPFQTVENLTKFQLFLKHVFATWSAVEMVLQHGHLGKEGPQLFVDFQNGIFGLFKGDPLITKIEIVEYMHEVIEEDLDCDFEDGSIEIVCELIYNCWIQLVKKNDDSICKKVEGDYMKKSSKLPKQKTKEELEMEAYMKELMSDD